MSFVFIWTTWFTIPNFKISRSSDQLGYSLDATTKSKYLIYKLLILNAHSDWLDWKKNGIGEAIVQFISYSTCSNWRRISKLLTNFGCLFTFCYSLWANQIKTKLQTCNLQTGQSISYKYVNQLKVNRHPKFNNNFNIQRQLEHFEYEMIHA